MTSSDAFKLSILFYLLNLRQYSLSPMGEGKGFLNDWFWFVDGEVLPVKYRSMWEYTVL